MKKNAYKLAHTWRKTGKGSLIMGGMAANK